MTFPQPADRSIRVTLLRWGVLILGAVQLWQAILLARQLSLLRTLTNTVPPEIRLALAAGWGITWLACWGTAQRAPGRFERIISGVTGAYLVYQFLLIWLTDSPVARAGWPITLLGYGAFFLLALGPRLSGLKRWIPIYFTGERRR